jgi:hypothetical protein
MKILRSGMNVFIDTSGGKGQSFAINYPLPTENRDLQQNRIHEEQEQDNSPESMDREKRMQMRVRKNLDEAIQLSLDGFNNCSGGFVVKQANNCGIVVRMAMDEYYELIWEASIPFKTLYGKEHIDKKDEGRPISVCFQVKGLKKPEKPKGDSGGANDNAAAGMHGGGGMGTGGGRGGGMHNGGQTGEGREAMFETSKTWKQFGLAYKE